MAAGDHAFVELSGIRHYIGGYDTPASREKHHRPVAEWRAHGCALPVPQEDILVVEVAAGFLDLAEGYYRRAVGTRV